MEEYAEELNERSRRPGEILDDGGRHEPDHEPVDLGEYIRNQFDAGVGINGGTGYLLEDGTPVQMGNRVREQDHRAAIPSHAAMVRWNWPPEVTKAYAEGTRTPAMVELLRRSGAVRVIAGDGELVLHHAAPITSRQSRAIKHHVVSYRPRAVIIEPHGAKAVELSNPDEYEIDDAVESANRRINSTRR